MTSRCALCPKAKYCVPSDGPLGAKLCFVGEAPGKDEDKYHRPFVGKAGQEVNDHYLPLAGLRRPNVWFGNAIACMPTTTSGKLKPDRAKDVELLECCSAHQLFPSLQIIKPNLIVPMGSFACMAIDRDIDLEYQHGMPLQTKRGMLFPMYHPALGIHEPKKMLHIRTDWYKLGQYLKGNLIQPVDEWAGQEDYRSIESVDELHSTLEGYEDLIMACDTENRKDRSPFCLTYSLFPGTGYLIRADRQDLLDVYQGYLDRWRGKILWHNWLHDFEITTAMGLRFNERLIVDTMLKVFHLGNLPQGLKALCYRELGIEMEDFESLVKPFSNQLAIKYLRDALCTDWPKPEQALEKDKNGMWKIKSPHSFNTKLKTFFTNFYKSDGEKDVLKAWGNWEAEHQMVQEKIGQFPGMCISHVPFELVIRYACQDADGLGRLYPQIKRMESRVRKVSQEKWRE